MLITFTAASIFGTAPRLLLIVLLVVALVYEMFAIYDYRRVLGTLVTANRQLEAQAVQAVELAAERVRTGMARELHDRLGHHLTVVNMELNSARTELTSSIDSVRESIDEAQLRTKQALREVRRVVADLRDEALINRSLPDALQVLLGEHTPGLQKRLTVQGLPRRLAPDVTFALYQIAQEALTNILKHAQASTAMVTLNFHDPSCIRLRVQDTGVGWTTRDAGRTDDGHFGLQGIKERVDKLGGRVNITSAAGDGFILEVEVPG